jgi:hypothetical protein
MDKIKLIGKYWVKIDVYVVVIALWVFVINPMRRDMAEIASQPRYSIQNDL